MISITPFLSFFQGNSELNCLNMCFNIDRPNCQLFVWAEEDCYLGRYDVNSGTLTSQQNETLFGRNNGTLNTNQTVTNRVTSPRIQFLIYLD
jgi:hypothetical protein